VAGEVELAREDLLSAIKQVTFAASTETTRYDLNGILLHDEGGQLVWDEAGESRDTEIERSAIADRLEWKDHRSP
jgi:hypothetical protein